MKNQHNVTWRRIPKSRVVEFRGGNLSRPVAVNEQYMLGRNYDTREDHINPNNDIEHRIESYIIRSYDPANILTGGLDAKSVRLKRQKVWDKVNKSNPDDIFWFCGQKVQVVEPEYGCANDSPAIIRINGGMILARWHETRWISCTEGTVYNSCAKHRVIRYVKIIEQ